MDLFLSPLIKFAARKAGNTLIEQYCRMRGMEENRERLERHLLAVQEKVADAEERGVNSPAVQKWMEELHAAALNAVDVLDEFQYEALRQNAISQKPSSSTKVMKSFLSSENPILFRQKMSNKLIKVLGQISKIVTEMNTFNLVSRHPAPTIDRETQSFVIETKVIGRESEKEKIVNALLDPQLEREDISVLAIVGMGGLGKTTLAQLVYNDHRVKRIFQLFMWVCVSNEFYVVNILKKIIELAAKGPASTSTKEVLQRKLREILDGKRYLLVLDDVWNEDRDKWDELKTLLNFGGSSGSVIIVTTRSKGVASIVGTLPSHDLTTLNEEDSWELFINRAFGLGVKKPREELVEIGRTIVRKCAGVPLALKAIGGLMETMQEECDWRTVAKNSIFSSLSSTNNILPVLKLSYDYLPPHIKQCFAFCAIFPQDHEIERETLIQLWMAHDFIPTDGKMDLEDKGRHIFSELYERSFFQDFKEKETTYGSIITCKMHDHMHELATQITGKKCSTALELNHPLIANKEVKHISVARDNQLRINSILLQFPNIHTYLFHHEQIEDSYNLLKSSSLRALDFQLADALRKELGYLKHIRYLDLSHGEFDTLPETISALYNLQTLKLSNSEIRELPKEMIYMSSLRHLFLDRCLNLQRMPIGLGQLKYLRTLANYIADSGGGGSIAELSNLNLCGHLSLSRLGRVSDRDAKAANLAAKNNLYSLELDWGRTDNEGTTGNNQAVLEALTPHKELKYLTITGYGGSDFPKWMMESLNIKSIKRLRLRSCINCAELPPVWQLPFLESLFLYNMKSVIYIVGGACLHAEGSESIITFRNLKVLKVKYLVNLGRWHEKDSKLVRFSKLENLVIRECPKLKTIPLHAPLLSNLEVNNSGEIKLHQISNLPMLSILEIVADTPPVEPDAFKPPKTLVEMEIEGFQNVSPLKEVDGKCFQAASLCTLKIRKSDCFFSSGPPKVALGLWRYFAALERLMIRECDALVFWPEEEFCSLKCLKKLDFYCCTNFTGASQVPSSQTRHGEDFLPQLEELELRMCPELVEVHGSYKSLKRLNIYGCPKLSREGLAELTNLAELKELSLSREGATLLDGMEHLTSLEKLIIWKFPNMRALPDGMEHLTSLQALSILDCPGIESFPEGLQQRLSFLQQLSINGCPALQRRCRSGGEYWCLVSNIPDLKIPSEATEYERPSRRLISICRRLSTICIRCN